MHHGTEGIKLWNSPPTAVFLSSYHLNSYKRSLEGSDGYLVVINTSEEQIKVDLLKDTTQTLPAEGTVLIRSITDTSSATQPGCVVPLNAVPLVGGEGLVLSLAEEDH
ncbi:hypothetical protein E2C01_053934 [Portunus trituberculatus]|uniref:Uncharacterized protein n=1 Tax=Portunus trituberculatus TaxID=210409 RepID=A0A5B7GRE0_PORTR|nr:hypothetical protein [Portunus trituberculatus]